MRGNEINEANSYVRSLRDPVKRRYASDYLAWIRGGRVGLAPGRGAVAPAIAKAVGVNLDALS